MSKLGFTPYATYLMVSVPKEAYELKGGLMVDEKVKENRREEWIKAGNEVLVVEKGDQCSSFVQVNDKVLVAGRGSFQRIELDGIDEVFYIIRESDLIGKLN